MKRIISVLLALFMLSAVIAGTASATNLPGDCNGDTLIDNKDVVVLFRYVSGGDSNAVEANCDFNNDGAIDNKDVVALFRAVSGGGSGSTSEDEEPDYGPIPEGAIQISNREELFSFAENVLGNKVDYSGKTIVLTDDIDIYPEEEGGKNWTPLSTKALKGATIDGRGHTIKNMTITQSDLKGSYGMGFIGISTTSLTIKNLVFKGACLSSSSKHVGCVIGSTEGSGSKIVIDNVSVIECAIMGGIGAEGDTTGISFRVGGIIGSNTEGGGCSVEVKNCKVEYASIEGFHNISGIVGCTTEAGNVKNTIIEDCSVKDVHIAYSASYAKSYKDPAASRYFADPFYSINDHWSEYHTAADLKNGNTYENVEFYDIGNNVAYKNEEGKTADFEGTFPVGTNTTRPVDQRP